MNATPEIGKIQQILLQYGSWLFPMLLFFIQFLLKRFVYNKPTGFELWKSVLEIPIDLKAMAISFLMAAALVRTEYALAYLSLSIVFVAAIAFSILVWAWSPKETTGKSIIISTVLGSLNLCVAIYLLTLSITLLQQKGN